MFCPKCGKEILDNSKFCKYCGKSIKKSTKVHKPITQKDKKTNNDKYLIAGIAVGVVILVILLIVAVGGFGILGGEDSSNNGVSSDGSVVQNNNPVSLNAFPVSEAPALASTVYNSGENYPVQYKSLSLTKAQCAYILTKSIYEISLGNTGATIDVGSPAYAGNPSGYDFSQSITSGQYVDMSNRFSSWIERNGVVPNYVGINTGGVPDISPTKIIDICCRVLMQYEQTGQLPTTISV